MQRIKKNHWDLQIGTTVLTDYPQAGSDPKEAVIENIDRTTITSQSKCLVKLEGIDSWLDSWWIYNA